MQPGPTSTESSPPSAPLPAAYEAVADSPAEDPSAAAEAEEAQPAVKVQTPPSPLQEGGEEAEEPREVSRGGRRRKRAGRGATASASSSPATAPAAGTGAGSGTVMVKRDLLARCLTCPLCHRLLRDATTISECLHTFCRKCIYGKFNDEEVECCPVCKRNLGCTPVEKLRVDRSLQDVRSNIFPLKRKKVNAEEVPSPDSLPTRRKERSISSLVVNTPKVKPTSLTGRRTRAVARKAAAALRDLGPVIEEDPVKKEIDSCDSQSQNSVFPANSGKCPQTRRQISSNAESSNHSPNTNVEDNNEELVDKGELWQPLNCLVEAANRTKPFRSGSQNAVVKGEQLNGSPSSTYATKTKAKEHLQRYKTEDDKKDVPMPPIMLNKRIGTGRRRRQLHAPADAKPDSAVTQNENKFSSIWFSLVAFDKQEDPPLPQIPSHYLRIKDGNVPASSIQKYLMQKLSLPSESEVEMKCCEQPVNPTQPLRKLVEQWLKGRSAQTTQAMIGSSAKEFVMVITYGRSKAPAL